MKKIAELGRESKKKRRLGKERILREEEYQNLDVQTKVELIKSLIPLGLMRVAEMLEEEVEELAGPRYNRQKGQPDLVRYGKNPGSVKLAEQRHPISVPRVRNQKTKKEVPLESWDELHGTGQVDDVLLRRVLYGISCRNYEAAAESVPESIGLSKSTVSRHFVEVSAKHLKEFNERDLSSQDFVALFLDGKTFAEDTMVIALGVTIDGEKVFLGFTQTGSENSKAITELLNELLDRGLKIEQGVLVVMDGGKGIRAGVKKAFKDKAVIQRCQWHKRENVVGYLPKSEQSRMRRKIQKAHKKATYTEAKNALVKIMEELDTRNISAAKSLKEGMEETLTLHRLGVFELLGISFKTTNCIESVMGMVEERCGKVDVWKNSTQKQRWLAASLLDIEPRLNRVKGCKHLSILRQQIQDELGIVQMFDAA